MVADDQQSRSAGDDGRAFDVISQALATWESGDTERAETLFRKGVQTYEREADGMAETLALSHHEHWDGPGYPNGIAGEAIPLVGRIGAVADVFDALTSDRPYRRALPNPTAYEMMAAERGGGISIPGFSTSSSRSARR